MGSAAHDDNMSLQVLNLKRAIRWVVRQTVTTGFKLQEDDIPTTNVCVL